MKKLLIKIPAMLAMLMALVSFVWFALSFTDLVHDEIGLLSSLMAIFSMPFFLVDAVISFVRAVKKDDPTFNFILTLILLGAIPLVNNFGGSGRVSYNIIWNIYYLVIFVLEAISIKKAWLAMRAGKKKAQESAGI